MLQNKKVILCDVDGVIIHGCPQSNKEWYFNLEKDTGISLNFLQERFFSIYWADIIIGKKDLKISLSEILQEIKTSLSMEELLDYWFQHDSAIDMDFIDLLIKNIKGNDTTLYLATNQEKYRKDYIYCNLGLNKYFKDVFYSGELGFKKNQDEYWKYIKNQFSTYKAEELLLIDDSEENIRKAKEHGIDGYIYIRSEKTKKELFKN